MRARFFSILVSVLLVVVVGTSILHGEFLRREKIELIDQQVRDTAAALLDSELGRVRKIEFERVEHIISEELGENRIGKFFVIRNNAGDILFESAGAKLLGLHDIPRKPRWITLRQKRQYVRILNLDLPSVEDRTLQVGLVIGEELVSPGYFSRANLLFTGGIVAFGLVLAWVLTSLLMRPVQRLARFLSSTARDPSQRMELPALPKELKHLADRGRPRDELAELLAGFEKLIERVNRDYKVSRFWSYQMAHELKTPMAIIEARVTEAQKAGAISDAVARSILGEVFETAETITSFLSWAETENSTGQKRLFVVRAAKLVQDLRARLGVAFAERLELRIRADFDILTNLQHAEQAVTNLVVNALIYSPADRPVVLEVDRQTIRVLDHGPGLPPAVRQRLGEPFNKGERAQTDGARSGTGLGLALVFSISRLYDWRLEFESGHEGTLAILTFPEVVSA